VTAHNRQLRAAQRQYENQSPPDDDGGLLECPVEAHEFVATTHGEAFTDAAFEIVEGWIAGPQDKFAEARMLREMKALADRYVAWCAAEDAERAAPDGEA